MLYHTELEAREAVINKAYDYFLNEERHTPGELIYSYNNLMKNYFKLDKFVELFDYWDCVFVSIIYSRCLLHHAIPIDSDTESQINSFKELGRWKDKDYLPKPGDLVYFYNTKYIFTVGIVLSSFEPDNSFKAIIIIKDKIRMIEKLTRFGIIGFGIPNFDKIERINNHGILDRKGSN